MPIYDYECPRCFSMREMILPMGSPPPKCLHCGKEMKINPSYPVMVKVKGSGGYPSRRKMVKDTAPYCRG